MYQDISMSERLDRIGELLAKGVYLYMKKEKEADKKAQEQKEAIQPRIGWILTIDKKNQ